MPERLRTRAGIPIESSTPSPRPGEEVEREVAEVARVAGTAAVQAILVVHRADLPWLGTLWLGSIPVVPADELAKRIASGPQKLTADAVTTLAGRIDVALPRA
jgi:hypothetical protein